jgi:NNP family nitrate/nitrite transporter-like MFS transporter
MATLVLAVSTMILFSLFVQMSEGATYGIVPFINRRALGAVAGIVGAGGNAGAVAAGFLFKAEAISYADGLLYLGFAVMACSFLAWFVRFSPLLVAQERDRLQEALALRASPSTVAAE